MIRSIHVAANGIIFFLLMAQYRRFLDRLWIRVFGEVIGITETFVISFPNLVVLQMRKLSLGEGTWFKFLKALPSLI